MPTNLSALDASRAALNRLPFLAGAALHFHLKEELEKLRKQESWQRITGRSSKTLATYPDFHIVLVLMKPGSKMNEHHVDGRVSLQIASGKSPDSSARSNRRDPCGRSVGAGIRTPPPRQGAKRKCVSDLHLLAWRNKRAAARAIRRFIGTY